MALLLPAGCVLAAMGVFSAGGVCELWVLLLWMVEPGEEPPGDRFSSQSLDSLDEFWEETEQEEMEKK